MDHPSTLPTPSPRRARRPRRDAAPAPSFEHAIWRLALACFVLAAATGAALRFGTVHGLPFGLTFDDLRHAHSHLMFFSWVTPVLMTFTLAWGRRRGARRGGRWIAGLALASGLATYVPFLLSGYGSLSVGGRDLPLSMMTAGLAGVSWYLFAAFHAWSTRGLTRTVTLRALDGAVALLTLASLGATLLGALGATDGPWRAASIALFLESFGDGWFTLALLALAYASHGVGSRPGTARVGVPLLTLALLVRGPARLATEVGVAGAEAPATLAAFAAGLGLLAAVGPLLSRERGLSAWTLPVAFLIVKGLAELLLAWPDALAWSDAQGLHVPLLHAFLLGAVSLGLVAAARDLFGPAVAGAPAWLSVAVLTMLAALVPLTGPWPAAWGGPWIPRAAAWTSLGPPLVVAASLLFTAAFGRAGSARREAG